MCEQCLVNPLYFGCPLPGWYLIRARREGGSMKVGDWGLVQCNDPAVIWRTTPLINPVKGMTEEEEDVYFADAGRWRMYDDRAEEFEQSCLRDLSIGECYDLVAGCVDVGYRRKEDGNPVVWLFDYLGDWIEKTEPTTDNDPFPYLDEQMPHDYSMSKEDRP